MLHTLNVHIRNQGGEKREGRERKEIHVEESKKPNTTKPSQKKKWTIQRSTAINQRFPHLSTSRGYSALMSAAFFPGSSGIAWIKLMRGHVLAAYYLLQF